MPPKGTIKWRRYSNILPPRIGAKTMGVKKTVHTKDLEVEFFDKSFRVKGSANTIWTDRLMNNTECQHIADVLQDVHDIGSTQGHKGPIFVDPDLPKNISNFDVDEVVLAQPKQGMHHRVGEAMERALKRLDDTYEDEEDKEWTPEHGHKVRVGLMAGMISMALNMGRERGLDEATDNLKKLVRGVKL